MLTFQITGPANSYGQATFLGTVDGSTYKTIAVVPITPTTPISGGVKTMLQDVSFGTPYAAIIANVDNLIPGVGAVPTTSISY
jgi:hypothetical protein